MYGYSLYYNINYRKVIQQNDVKHNIWNRCEYQLSQILQPFTAFDRANLLHILSVIIAGFSVLSKHRQGFAEKIQ